MDFRDEYKKEITELSSDETAQRIREGVMAKLAQSTPSYPETPAKKPLPIKRIAVIGGSIAACLVIGFTAAAVNNTRIGSHLSGGMAPGANNMNHGNPAPGSADGTAQQPNQFEGIAGEIDAAGGANMGQSDGAQWGDSAQDSGGATSAPENEQNTSMPVQADSESRYPDSGEPGMSPLALISFEGDGFTLTDGLNGRVHRFSPIESDDVAGTYLSPDDLRNYSLFYTAEGEEYIIMEAPGVITLLNDKLLILGRYVIVE